MEERGYEVLRLLGCGGQGRVYEVQNRQGKRCVLKQLPWTREEERTRSLQEVRLLSSLRHPCIVPYLDSFPARSMPSLPSEDVLCLVMSRCEHDLRFECQRKRQEGQRFAETQVLTWLAQLCWGLHYLHARKFLHRDLKPQNVLLNARGHTLLADFGVAGQLEHTEDFRQTVVGTPSFMSPEMLEGRPYGCKTDQWALGCVLFEIMGLEAPFALCESYAAIVGAVLHAPALRAPPGYSEELSHTLEALLAKRPDDRPSNAELLGGAVLVGAFKEVVQASAEVIEAGSSRAPSPWAGAESASRDADAESYASDFESYSGSDGEEADREGSLSLGGFRQLRVEAHALMRPQRTPEPADEVRRVRAALCRGLGSVAAVDEALGFLRARQPLSYGVAGSDVGAAIANGTEGASSTVAPEEEELLLQIEVYDAFGGAGLQALPLLERCLELESRVGVLGGSGCATPSCTADAAEALID